VALVRCRECGTQVSSEAPTCPRCGVPRPSSLPGPPPPRGLDPGLHAWLFGQLVRGVPKSPLARRISSTYDIPQKEAMALVRSVESQALAAVGGRAPSSRRPRRNVAATLLSLWIPGLGQLTQGRFGRGLAMFGGAALLWIVLLGWIMHIVAATDAARWDPVVEA